MADTSAVNNDGEYTLSTEEFFKLFEQWLDPWLEEAEESDNPGCKG